MTTKNLLKALGRAAVLTIMVPTVASAYIQPWDRPSCYISIHDQCYGGGEENCTQEDYESALDECNTMYPSPQAIDVGPKLNKKLKAIEKAGEALQLFKNLK